MTIKKAKQVTGGQPPIGQPFEYTETLDFASDKKAPWWKFWLRTKKQPVAWLVSDEDEAGGGVVAHTMTNRESEVRISPVEPASALTPIYIKDVVEDLLLAAEQREGVTNGNA